MHNARFPAVTQKHPPNWWSKLYSMLWPVVRPKSLCGHDRDDYTDLKWESQTAAAFFYVGHLLPPVIYKYLFLIPANEFLPSSAPASPFLSTLTLSLTLPIITTTSQRLYTFGSWAIKVLSPTQHQNFKAWSNITPQQKIYMFLYTLYTNMS